MQFVLAAEITGDDDGQTYAVTSTSARVDRTTGEDKAESKEIADGLKMVPIQ